MQGAGGGGGSTPRLLQIDADGVGDEKPLEASESIGMLSTVQKKKAIAASQPSRRTERRTKGEGACTENHARANPGKVPATPRPNAVAGGPNTDERLKAARERREEQQKLLACRVQSRREREQRAGLRYQQQLQDRQRKLKEQKIKEERRRCAAEEKRKQRLQEDKERNESAVRRTQEKSQKAQQIFSPNPRDRKSAKNVPRPLALSKWEKNLVSRLLTPTSSYLARSKSSACQSGEEVVHICRRAVSFYSTTNSSSGSTPQRPREQKPQKPRPQNQRPQQQKPQNQGLSPSPGPGHSQTRSTNRGQIQRTTHDADKRNQNIAGSPPSKTTRHASSPFPQQARLKSTRRHSIPLQLDLPSVPEEDVPICTSALLPGNSRPARIEGPREEKMQDSLATNSDLLDFEAELESRTAGDGSPAKIPPHLPEVQLRPSAGTTDPEEAFRLLAAKRREARLLREREAQDCLQAAEAESREELEERARQRAEAQRLTADKRRREEEEQRRAEEERARAMREAALLLKQRQDEQAREREEAAQLTKERELLAQKEDAERRVRKKRLEEIMRRTRRTSPDTKSAAESIVPKETSELPVHSGTVKDADRLPAAGPRPQQLVLDRNGDDAAVPVVGFKERRSLRTLAGLEDIQTHQRAEVI